LKDIEMPLCGGISDSDKPATPEIQGFVTQVSSQIAGKMNSKADVFEAVSYRSQVVAGCNYFVKIHVGNDNYIHARIFKSLQQEVSLHSIQESKTKDDVLEYF